MRDAPLLIAEFYRTPWGVLPETLGAMQLVLERWASGVKLSREDVAAAVGDAPEKSAARRDRAVGLQAGSIGVLPVYGIIGHRASLVYDSSSGVNTSTELLGQAFAGMLADPAIGAIVFDIDSPGGSVYGVGELGEQIYAARGSKPIVAVANSLAASAAYWLASSADEIVVTPGGEVGSIGVFAAHQDISKALDYRGVKTTLISAGKYKTEGNPYEPLAQEARDFIQSRVDEYYGAFVKAVARNRRKDTQTNVREGYGQGRVLGAAAAVKAKLADRVATFDSVIAELQAKLSRGNGARAEALEAPNAEASAETVPAAPQEAEPKISRKDVRKEQLEKLSREFLG